MSEAQIQDINLNLNNFSYADGSALFSFANYLQAKQEDDLFSNSVSEEESRLIDEGLMDIAEGRVLTLKDVFHEKEFAHLV
jgi:hypothetical protein